MKLRKYVRISPTATLPELLPKANRHAKERLRAACRPPREVIIMPRAPKSSLAHALRPEALSLWSKILTRAELFRETAPWQWIDGASLLGVRDLVSGEIDWCTIMGQGGETFGVAIYPGEAGLRSLQRMLDHGPDEFDAILQQKAHVLTFNDRNGITKDMTVILKACDRRYRGANAWPELIVYDPGLFPIPPCDEATLARTVNVLDCLFSMFAQSTKNPGWEMVDDEGRAWVALPEADGMTTVVRQAVPVIPPLPLPMVPIDEVAVGRIRAKGRAPGNPVLIDWFPGDAVIDGPEANGRPYFAMHLLAFDTTTEMILGAKISSFSTVWTEMAHLLLSIAEQGGVPSQVVVRRPEALTILGPLSQALGTKVMHHKNAANVARQFRNQLQAMMR